MESTPNLDLLESIIQGDPRTLIRLWKAMDKAHDDDEMERAVEEFDRLSLLYAMGRPDNPKSEWYKFREVISYYRKGENAHAEIESVKERLARNAFETNVLEHVRDASTTLNKDAFQEEIEVNGYARDMLEVDLRQEEAKLEFCEAWLEEARKHFTDPRFTSLPAELFDELVDVVSHELEDAESFMMHEQDSDDSDGDEAEVGERIPL